MLLTKLARTIRSKNAGAYTITVEIIFDKPEVYTRIKENELVTRRTIAEAYGIEEDAVLDFVYYDAGLAIKANFRRKEPSGGPGETDVYGCQQYAPLLLVDVPETISAVG